MNPIGILILVVVATFVKAEEKLKQVAHLGPPPSAGISDTELDAMSKAKAEEVLVKQFTDPGSRKFKKGLLLRMALYGDLTHPNASIRKAITEFVDSEVSSCVGQVDADRIFTLRQALEVLGQRGGPAAQKYLEGWVVDDAVSGQVQCYYGTGTVGKTRDLLRNSAILGIGRSGSHSALEFLNEVAQHPPKVNYPGSFMGVLNGAIDENQRIQKAGIEKLFEADRENIRAHMKRPNREK